MGTSVLDTKKGTAQHLDGFIPCTDVLIGKLLTLNKKLTNFFLKETFIFIEELLYLQYFHNTFIINIR